MKKKKKFWRYMIVLAFLSLVTFVVCCNVIIAKRTSGKCYDNIADIPYNKVGLLLGTSPTLSNGNTNLYFKYRIQAATELYKAGKIKYLLVSGDNRRKDYNEPQEMKDALVKQGIPADAIYLDYAGLRTLDSVVRAKLIFGQENFTVISQKFHNERAIYLAYWHDVEAVGYDARDVRVSAGFRTIVREWFARVKVFIDLIINKKPRHLGDPVQIPS